MPTTSSRPGPGRRPVQGVTTARVSVEEDRARRMRNYLLAMGFRILGFPVSVWLLLHGFVVVGVVLAAAATVVPSIAMMVANAVDRRGTSTQDARPVSPVQGLGPAPGTPEHDAGAHRPAPAGEEIRGTVVSRRETPYPPAAPGGRAGDGDPGADPRPDLGAS